MGRAAYYDDANRFEDIHPKWGDIPPILAVEVWSLSDRPGLSVRVADLFKLPGDRAAAPSTSPPLA